MGTLGMSCLAQLSRQKLIWHSQARVQSNNTAEMSAMVEALSFLEHHGLVAREAHACVVYDSKHAVHVQLGLSC